MQKSKWQVAGLVLEQAIAITMGGSGSFREKLFKIYILDPSCQIFLGYRYFQKNFFVSQNESM